MTATVARRCHCGTLVFNDSFEEKQCSNCGFKRKPNEIVSISDTIKSQVSLLQSISGVNVDLYPSLPDLSELEFQR